MSSNGRNKTKKRRRNNNNTKNRNNNNNNNNNNSNINIVNNSRIVHPNINYDNVISNIEQYMVELFPDLELDQIVVKYQRASNDDTIEIRIDGCKEENNHPEHWSPEATIMLDEREMHIETLIPCGGLSGTQILEGFIEIARRIRLYYVTLDDASMVYFPKTAYGKPECSIPLSILEILQSGQSWYQRKGFNSNFNRLYLESNLAVALMPFNDFIEILIKKDIQSKKNAITKHYKKESALATTTQAIQKIERNKIQKHKAIEADRSLINSIREHFPTLDTNNMVSEVIYQMIVMVLAIEPERCEHNPKLEVLQRIVDLCTISNDPIIKYNPRDLILTFKKKAFKE